MKLRDITQTVIFISCLIMIPVFGLAYCFYAQTDIKLSEVFDKSFGVMVGVFSGVATLAAAYIASLLFNDWRVQHNKQLLASEAKELHKKISNLTCISSIYWSTTKHHMHSNISKKEVLNSFEDLQSAIRDILSDMVSFHQLSGESGPLMEFMGEISDLGNMHHAIFRQFECSNNSQNIAVALFTTVDQYNYGLKEVIKKINNYTIGFILLDLS